MTGKSPAHFALYRNSCGLMCKVLGLDARGKLTKSPAAWLMEGEFQRLSAGSIDDFLLYRDIFASDPSAAFSYGVPKGGIERAVVVNEDRRPYVTNSISRTRGCIEYLAGAPGVWYTDYDPSYDPSLKVYSPEELDAIFCDALPGLQETRRAWVPSSSSALMRPDGQPLAGAAGMRMYVLVDDAAAIPRLVDYLFQSLWALGYGWAEAGAAGQTLLRSLCDANVGQPERLDFIAVPVLNDGLWRDAQKCVPLVRGSVPMLATAFADDTEPMASWRRTNPRVQEERTRIKPACQRAFDAHVDSQLPLWRDKNPGAPDEDLRRWIGEAQESSVLTEGHVCFLADGTPITVGELLAERARYDGAVLLDPLEPQYDGGRPVAKAFLHPGAYAANIHSQAHGGRNFELSGAALDAEREAQRGAQTTGFRKCIRLPAIAPGCPQKGPEGPVEPASSVPAVDLVAPPLAQVNWALDRYAEAKRERKGDADLSELRKQAVEWMAQIDAVDLAAGKCSYASALEITAGDLDKAVRGRQKELRRKKREGSAGLFLEFPVCNELGVPVSDAIQNVEALLAFEGKCLQYNEFSLREEILDKDGGIRCVDDVELRRIWYSCQRRGFRPTLKFVKDSVDSSALNFSYHPVAQYFERLKWDGQPRLDTFFSVYAGAKDTPLARAAARLVFAVTVRRIRAPGTYFRYVIILGGRQDAGKSYLIRSMCPRDDWFTDSFSFEYDDKQVIEQTSGKLFVEIGELKGLRPNRVDHIKAFVTRTHDRARAAYGYKTAEVPRQWVAFATTNEEAYLTDTTGNTRFLPIEVGEIDWKAIQRDRDQLWAEAVAMEPGLTSLDLPEDVKAEAKAAQDLRTVKDAPYEALEAAVADIEAPDAYVPKEDLYAAMGLARGEDGAGVNRRSNRHGVIIKEVMKSGGWREYERMPRDLARLMGISARPGGFQRGTGTIILAWNEKARSFSPQASERAVRVPTDSAGA